MNMKFTVFDVETPNGKNDRICSLGLALVDDGAVVRTESYLIDPECDFSHVNVNIHGIVPNMVRGCPRFIDIWPKLEPLFVDRIVVAHKASFDLSVLCKTLSFYGQELPSLRFLDTCSLARSYYPDLPNCRLDTICSILNYHLEHHNAGSDALAAANVLLDMLRHGLSDKEIQLYTPDNEPSDHRSQRAGARSDINALLRLISTFTADGIITSGEFHVLLHWLRDHLHLMGNNLFDEILYHVANIIEDGQADEDELEDLCRTLESLRDPVDEFYSSEKPLLSGLKVVLSGNFARGSKDAVAAELESQGAMIQAAVGKKTGLVLVGSLGNDAWASGTYGTKIKKAIELQSQGLPVKIMREEDFFGR